MAQFDLMLRQKNVIGEWIEFDLTRSTLLYPLLQFRRWKRKAVDSRAGGATEAVADLKATAESRTTVRHISRGNMRAAVVADARAKRRE